MSKHYRLIRPSNKRSMLVDTQCLQEASGSVGSETQLKPVVVGSTPQDSPQIMNFSGIFEQEMFGDVV